jgi:hypothetical protein
MSGWNSQPEPSVSTATCVGLIGGWLPMLLLLLLLLPVPEQTQTHEREASDGRYEVHMNDVTHMLPQIYDVTYT